MGKLYLRPVLFSDCSLLLQWANDSDVRKNSFNTTEITFLEHKEWLAKVLKKENILLYILMEDDTPVGQVRLESQGKWKVSYSIAPAYRAQGYGKIILQLAENELISEGYIGDVLYAEVKTNNVASQRIFIGLGYLGKECQRKGVLTFEKTVNRDLYKINVPMSVGGGHASF